MRDKPRVQRSDSALEARDGAATRAARPAPPAMLNSVRIATPGRRRRRGPSKEERRRTISGRHLRPAERGARRRESAPLSLYSIPLPPPQSSPPARRRSTCAARPARPALQQRRPVLLFDERPCCNYQVPRPAQRQPSAVPRTARRPPWPRWRTPPPPRGVAGIAHRATARQWRGGPGRAQLESRGAARRACHPSLQRKGWRGARRPREGRCRPAATEAPARASRRRTNPSPLRSETTGRKTNSFLRPRPASPRSSTMVPPPSRKGRDSTLCLGRLGPCSVGS